MELVLHLEYKPSVPLFRRLSDALRKAIVDGRLSPGQRLPSVRDLSSSLRISRATVLRSLEDLHSQGYLESSPRSGAHVRRTLPGELGGIRASYPDERALRSHQVAPVGLSVYGARLLENDASERATAFLYPETNYGGPPLDLAPLKQWKDLLVRHCRKRDLCEQEYILEPFGYPPLRQAVAAFLRQSRAVRCTAEQIMVFSSRQARLSILARVLLDPGDHVAVENPGFPGFRHVAAPYGAIIDPVPIDGEGISVESLRRLRPAPKLVYVTPSPHDPTGVVMSLARRKELLAWAHSTATLVLEDDFDCEYCYEGQLLPSLQGIDYGNIVIYRRCFWKVLFPVLRLGFLVIPKQLVPIMSLAKAKVERDVPLLEQLALTDFINEGHLERHILRISKVYDARRQAMVKALTRYCASFISISKASSGMHLIIWIHSTLSDEELHALAFEAGISMLTTGPYYVGQPRRGEFMISFAQHDELEIEATVKQLARLLNQRGG